MYGFPFLVTAAIFGGWRTCRTQPLRGTTNGP